MAQLRNLAVYPYISVTGKPPHFIPTKWKRPPANAGGLPQNQKRSRDIAILVGQFLLLDIVIDRRLMVHMDHIRDIHTHSSDHHLSLGVYGVSVIFRQSVHRYQPVCDPTPAVPKFCWCGYSLKMDVLHAPRELLRQSRDDVIAQQDQLGSF